MRFYKIKKNICLIILFFAASINTSLANIIEKIEIKGNQRISSETIILFSGVSIKDDLSTEDLNIIIKKLYDTGYFENIKIGFENSNLIIIVEENPIIQNLSYEGIKAKKIMEIIQRDLKLKSRFSFNKFDASSDRLKISENLKKAGYYFSNVELLVENLNDNKVNLTYKIELGDKAKIQSIKFIGNKIFKDNKLKSLIISEEYKFWKFISGKKFLNEAAISFDERLLRNFYLNKGYYNVEINSSFAKLVDEESFDLIYNINPGKKFFFADIQLILPDDFDKSNFKQVENIFDKIKNTPYSINSIEKILNEIDQITLDNEYQSIKASIKEDLIDDKIYLEFIIEESDKYYVELINIYGNNITQESVIRNQFLIDEGDPFNEILSNKSINNIKSLNFFKTVNYEIKNGSEENLKIIDISVEEKPTGEIGASAGVGTSGSTVGFTIKENNFLGRGIKLNSNLFLSSESVKGLFSVSNPNFLNTDKSIYTSFESSETDKLEDFGYKNSKTGLLIGTNFEYYRDLRTGIGISNYYEKIETDSSASARQKSQEGNYWDSYLKFDLDLDKRNQKFQTSSGYLSYFSTDLPIVSKTNSLKNSYEYKYFKELYENNVSTFGLTLETVNSISNDNVKLSERLYIPSSKLRGFEYGKVGPKDSSDYIGGNNIATMNFSSTLPQLFENSQNTDFLIFMDFANIWGVDYNSNLSNSNKIRSSIGFGVDWFTPVGPLNFSLAQPISKDSNDVSETFRFNLGTTF